MVVNPNNQKQNSASPEQKITPTEQDLAQRLGPAHVGLRKDLQVHRHVFNSIPSYVIRDPITLDCHRLSLKEYQILTCITPERSLAEIFGSFVHDGTFQPQQQDEFYRFVMLLHQLAFLRLPVADSKILHRRFQTRRQAQLKAKMLGFLFLRVPLINPNAFLNKTVHLAKPLFTKWFFTLWIILLAGAGYLAVLKSDELFTPLNNILSGSNLVCMWWILISLKVLHELGHAFACKIAGGHVPEMGIFLIAFTPCAYVDVTSSWAFTNKKDRIIVGLAGVYIESIIASLALFVWAFTTSYTAQAIAYNVFFLASILTLIMNINPLMRFDGYYVLSDLLEMPNLRSRSQKFALQIIKRIFLGGQIVVPKYSTAMKVILFLFGITSSLYKITVILSISAVISCKIFLAGVFMAGFYLANELTRTLRRLIFFLHKSPEAASVRIRAIVLSSLALIGIPLLFFLLPVPAFVAVPGQMGRQIEHVIRVPDNGFVREVVAYPGDLVEPNMLLVRMENYQLLEEFHQVKADLDIARCQLDTALAGGNDAVVLAMREKKVDLLHTEWQQKTQHLQQLNLRAPARGEIISGFGKKNLGRFLKKGDIAGVIANGHWITKCLLNQQEVSRTQPAVGDHVQIRLTSCPGTILSGQIQRIAPAGSRQVDLPALTSLADGAIDVNQITRETVENFFEVTIALDLPATLRVRHGMTALVRLKADSQPLGVATFRNLLRWFNKLKRA